MSYDSLEIDFESRSDIDIKTRGVYVYFESPNTKPLMASYILKGGKVRRWLPNQPCPSEIVEHVQAGGIVSAHNSAFERLMWQKILTPFYDWPVLKLEQCRCTLATASALGLPRSLDKLGSALNLPIRKDKLGKELIRFFCVPRKPTKIEPPGLYFNEPDDFPEKFEQFRAYCDADVLTESEADKRMIPLSAEEQKVWLLDQEINSRGIRVDTASAVAAIRLLEKAAAKMDAEMKAATGGAVTACSQVAKLTAWVAERGILLEGVAKDDILAALKLVDLPSDVRQALELRQEAGKASTSKLKAFLNRVCADGRIRGAFVFWGAAPGRWSSTGVNMGNMPRPRAQFADAHIDPATLFEAFRTEDPDYLKFLFGPDLGRPLHLVSDAIRSFVIAAPGHRFIAADYSNIQGAICAWLAGEEWKLQAMREIFADPKNVPDLYRRAAAKIMNLTTDIVTKKHPLRQSVGKVSELSCFAADTYVLTNKGAKRVVEVQLTDLLWDGVEWVKHQGLVERSARPVVVVDGIEVTPDHLIMTRQKWLPAQQLASDADCLAQALETGSANLPSQVSATGLRREIFDSSPAKPTASTSEKLATCKPESPSLRPVFDILNAGPRNRFTICSATGFFLAHNCQFQGGVSAFHSMSINYSVALDPLYEPVWGAADEATRNKAVKRYERALKSKDKRKADVLSQEAWIACDIIVQGWRAANTKIAESWDALEDAARAAIMCPGVKQRALGKVDYLFAAGYLWCRLPSGRCIAYSSPKLKDQVWARLKDKETGEWLDQAETMDRDIAERLQAVGKAKIDGACKSKITALGVDSASQKFVRYPLYGGLFMENLCLAIERDILVQGFWNLKEAGYKPCPLHVYDEAVVEEPYGFGSVEEVERLLCQQKPWADGIPIAASGFEAKRYKKD